MPSVSLFARAVSALRQHKDNFVDHWSAAMDLTGFLDLVEAGDTQAVREQLSKAPSLAKRTRSIADETALMVAARSGQQKCLQLLLPLSDARASDSHGSTALMMAASRGHVGCLEVLVPVSDWSAEDSELKMQALEQAAFHGHVQCVEVLLAGRPPQLVADLKLRGAESKALPPQRQENCVQFQEKLRKSLHVSVYNGGDACVQVLLTVVRDELDQDLDVYAKPLLVSAAMRGMTECVQLLMPLCGHLNAPADNGQTALMHSCLTGQKECVKLLLSRSDLEQRDPNGNRSLEICMGQHNWACADLLVSRMSNVEAHALLAAAPAGMDLPNSRARVEQEALARELAMVGQAWGRKVAQSTMSGSTPATASMPEGSASERLRVRRL